MNEEAGDAAGDAAGEMKEEAGEAAGDAGDAMKWLIQLNTLLRKQQMRCWSTIFLIKIIC